MKKKIFVIVIVTIFIAVVAIFFIPSILNKIELNKFLKKSDLSNHCINNIYYSDYIGITLECPNGLIAQEIYDGYSITPKEGDNFIDKNKKTIFSVILRNQKFNKENVIEGILTSNNIIPIKIENVNEVIIGNNKFYTYSFNQKNDDESVFIYTKSNSYIEFRFYNQNDILTKNIMNSVKIKEPAGL